MDPDLRALLDELYQFGRQNDAVETEQPRRMLNITPETGDLLRMLVISGSLKRVLELGTSNGYSTLWLADACRQTGGAVVTVDRNPDKYSAAMSNFRRAGMERWIEARVADIGEALPGLRDFDLVFLDCDRNEYVGFWPHLQTAVRAGGLIVVDNVTSHPHEVADFIQAVGVTPGYSTVLLPIGNGELLILKEP